MIEKILLEEYARIDSRAVREKSDVVYTVGLVQKNYEQVVEVVGTEDDRTLYDFVEKAFRQAERAFYPHGALIVHVDSEEFKEAVSLNWIKDVTGTVDRYYNQSSFCLTGKGIEIVKDYKEFKENLPKEAR